MRSFILITALVFGISAGARSLQPKVVEEILPHVLINGQDMGQTGRLKIDFVKNEIQIEILNDMCGQLLPLRAGEFRCLAAAVLVETLKVPLVDFSTSCRSVVYSGEKDDSPHDGFHRIIEVTDHSRRECKDIVESVLMVKASSFNPWTNTTTVYSLMK